MMRTLNALEAIEPQTQMSTADMSSLSRKILLSNLFRTSHKMSRASDKQLCDHALSKPRQILKRIRILQPHRRTSCSYLESKEYRGQCKQQSLGHSCSADKRHPLSHCTSAGKTRSGKTPGYKCCTVQNLEWA